MKKRVLDEALFIINNDATIRDTATHFNVSKSLIHNNIHSKLRKENIDIYNQVLSILDKHNKNKHILGGLATKIKYQRGNI